MKESEATRQAVIRRIARAPVLHFVMIGGLLYLASQWLREPAPSNLIRISTHEIAELGRDWRRRTGRPPDRRELGLLIDSHIEEVLLMREAFSLGWHRSDPIVQRRLLKNQRFLNADAGTSDAELLELAYEQGMDRSDIVVRRRLLERMKLAIMSASHQPEPTRAELAAYLARRPDRFERPARIRLDHVFLSRDLRGEQLERDAALLGERLLGRPIAPDAATRLGDPFLLSNQLPYWSEATLAGRLGSEFAQAAWQAPSDRWSGPIASSYGLHFIWPRERTAAELPPLEAIRNQVRAALLREREERALREQLEKLRERAHIVVQMPGDLPG